MGWLDHRWTLAFSYALCSCGPSVPITLGEDGGSDDATTDGTTSTEMTTSPGTTAPGSASNPGTSPVSTSAGTDPETSDDFTASASVSTTNVTTATDGETQTSGNPGGLPDGSQCGADEECFSDQCFVAGVLGGICGECNEDADCVGGGCSPPNPITSQPSSCNEGEAGGGCETDDVCAPPLVCGEVISVPGILDASTCGECLDDGDCGAQTCQPDYDITNITGVLECVAMGSLPNGHGCSLTSGAVACMSGHCPVASFMDLLELGVCSECTQDSDCGGASTCAPPEIDLAMGLIPGSCK